MSKIEWTQETWNPVTGCTKISQGCKNCYAAVMHKRLHAMGRQKKYSTPFNVVRTHEDVLDLPRRWKKPRVIFVNSMSDLFHKDVSDSFIQEVFKVMADTPQHTYQVLTKRADRLQYFRPSMGWPDNVWMGVSCESQDYVERVKLLAECGAKIKFVSCEPLLGMIDLNPYLEDIDWVIVGGESGSDHSKIRRMDRDAARWLRDQCMESSTAFFFKQTGTLHPCKSDNHPKCDGNKGCHYLDGQRYLQYPSEA